MGYEYSVSRYQIILDGRSGMALESTVRIIHDNKRSVTTQRSRSSIMRL